MAYKTMLLGVFAALVLTACSGQPSTTTQSTDTSVPTDTAVETNRITYTSSGFSPQTIRVQVGETVSLINESGRDMWPASDVHPTHTDYPTNQGACDETHFDSCAAVAQYEFTFDQAGTWEYHNHLRASDTGTVIVE